MFRLDNHLNNWNFLPENLASELGVTVQTRGSEKIIKNLDNLILFNEEKFKSKFIFNDNKLSEIILIPINCYDPGYPSKMYESLRFDFCKKFLSSIYGNKLIIHDNEVVYIGDNYNIKSNKILKGKHQFEGGNLIISMKKKNNLI